MPTVATKTLTSFRRRGKTITKTPTLCTYEEATEYQAQSERGDIPEMIVKITPQEHASALNKPLPDDPTPETPTDPAEREAAIVAAAADLDLDNTNHYTAAGLPDARALSGLLGWTVTAAERNEAFGVKTPDPAPAGKIIIKGKAEDPLDTGGETPTDPSTEGAVAV